MKEHPTAPISHRCISKITFKEIFDRKVKGRKGFATDQFHEREPLNSRTIVSTTKRLCFTSGVWKYLALRDKSPTIIITIRIRYEYNIYYRTYHRNKSMLISSLVSSTYRGMPHLNISTYIAKSRLVDTLKIIRVTMTYD